MRCVDVNSWTHAYIVLLVLTLLSCFTCTFIWVYHPHHLHHHHLNICHHNKLAIKHIVKLRKQCKKITLLSVKVNLMLNLC